MIGKELHAILPDKTFIFHQVRDMQMYQCFRFPHYVPTRSLKKPLLQGSQVMSADPTKGK